MHRFGKLLRLHRIEKYADDSIKVPVSDQDEINRKDSRLRRRGEEFFHTMARSARHAVLQASPLRKLPPEKHDQWREITFTFKPPS